MNYYKFDNIDNIDEFNKVEELEEFDKVQEFEEFDKLDNFEEFDKIQESEKFDKEKTLDIANCTICPRNCRINRNNSFGFCQGGNKVKIARAALHYMEEPCISGKNGSGTIFFSGCNLKCCYCQNFNISHNNYGKEVTIDRLSDIYLELQEKGANNINLVTPTSYVPMIIKSLDKIKNKLVIPIVYNCGGYEKPELIKSLKGYIDIYLQDIKYYSSELSYKYSYAKDYFKFACRSTKEMIKQVGSIEYYNKQGEENLLLKKGVIIRHLVLPGARQDSMKIIKWISENLEKDKYLISIMSQYSPCYKSCDYAEINRKVTTFEYNSVIDEAIRLGVECGYMQDKKSASLEYTPDFNLEGC